MKKNLFFFGQKMMASVYRVLCVLALLLSLRAPAKLV